MTSHLRVLRLATVLQLFLAPRRSWSFLPSFLSASSSFSLSNVRYNKSPHHHGWVCCCLRCLVFGQAYFFCLWHNTVLTPSTLRWLYFWNYICSLRIYNCAGSASLHGTLLLAEDGGGWSHRFHSSNTAWWNYNSICTRQLLVIWGRLKMCLLFRPVQPWSKCCPHIINKRSSSFNWTLP